MNALKSSGASNWVYQNLFKRNSSYFALILVGAIVVESGVSRTVDFWWNSVNKGRTWNDFKRTQLPKIQAKKAAAAEEEESDDSA